MRVDAKTANIILTFKYAYMAWKQCRVRIGRKFIIMVSLMIPQRFKCVATLSCQYQSYDQFTEGYQFTKNSWF